MKRTVHFPQFLFFSFFLPKKELANQNLRYIKSFISPYSFIIIKKFSSDRFLLQSTEFIQISLISFPSIVFAPCVGNSQKCLEINFVVPLHIDCFAQCLYKTKRYKNETSLIQLNVFTVFENEKRQQSGEYKFASFISVSLFFRYLSDYDSRNLRLQL